MQRIDHPMLPADWIIVNLEEVAEVGQGGTPSTQIIEYWNGNIPWLRSGEINFNRIVDSQSKITELGIQNSSARLLPKGTVLLAMTGQGLTRGRAALLGIESAANQSCAHILPNRKVLNNEFLFYYFMKEYWNIREIYKGSNQPGLNTTLIKKLRIPLTSPEEQIRIVSKIKELFSKLEISNNSLKNSVMLSAQYTQSTLKYAFAGKLTEKWRKKNKGKIKPISLVIKKGKNDGVSKNNPIDPLEENLPNLPHGWSWVPIGMVSEINPRFENKVTDHKLVSFLPMKNVEEETGRFNASITKPYGELKTKYTPFKDNDIIFAKITPCMENGKMALLHDLKNGIGFGSTEFHVIRVIDELVPEYFLFYFLQKEFREKAQKSMTGSAGQLRLPSKYLREFRIPLPPVKEQNEITREIQRRIIVASEVEKVVRQSLDQSQKLKQSILNMAFSGKLIQYHRDDNNILDLIQKFRAQ